MREIKNLSKLRKGEWLKVVWKENEDEAKELFWYIKFSYYNKGENDIGFSKRFDYDFDFDGRMDTFIFPDKKYKYDRIFRLNKEETKEIERREMLMNLK